jgi:hypothetical protein
MRDSSLLELSGAVQIAAVSLSLFQDAVAPVAEAEARNRVEIGAGDADDPGPFRVSASALFPPSCLI